MQQLIKIEQKYETEFDPQNKMRQQDQKQKPNQTKKKGFKIKKAKHASFRKHHQIDIFNNPIYAGLQNQDKIDENQQNFGPWIHQNIHLNEQQYNTNLKNQNQNQTQTLIQNHQILHQTQNFQRANFPSQLYLQIPIRSAILQQSDNTSISYLPEIKPKKQVHEIRLSSLDFNIDKKQNKSISIPNLSPPKIPKHKQLTMYRNKSQSQMIDLLKYESLKCFPSSEKITKKLESKTSNVIYNYCYSNNQNNMVLNYFRDTCNGSSGFGYLRTQKQDIVLKKLKGRSNSDKYNNGQNEGRTRFEKYNDTHNLKKSISKELYQDLIKKKKKK